ncbi:MAG: DNA (cytosine-5-)-methyltransferase [Marivibrio sp.]|uniref:DNA cytosine methyltransferase n=1 Tax=Marivibrio sp. TaxID=2039719 RepID=UPI0032EFE974
MSAGRPFYEFFAGGGLARLGLGPGWDCRFANEWSETKAAAYRAAFGPAPELRVADVARLAPADLPGRADLAWASFPCQDLSLAGGRAGMAGARSGTFHAFWGLMQGLAAEGRAPRAVALENVTGLLTSAGGADFAALVRLLAAGGYRVGALTLDAGAFVPQSRPRLFVLALDPSAASAAPQAPGPTGAVGSGALARAVSGLEEPSQAAWRWWRVPAPPARNANLIDLLEPDAAVTNWHRPAETERLIALMAQASRAKLAALQAAETRAAATVYRRTRPDGAGGKAQRAEIRDDGLAGCLRTPAGGSSRQIVLIAEGGRVRSRLLTPREAARLMGAPEEYPTPAGRTAAYHLFGDAVAVPVVRWLAQHLIEPALDGTAAGGRTAVVAAE